MPVAHLLPTSAAPPELLASVRGLLDAAFEGAFSDADWEHAQGGWHVVVREGGALAAHAAVVPRTLEVGDRALACGYVEGVAVAPDLQGRGLGSLAMTRLAGEVRRRFALGALSTDRFSFYRRLGWESWRGPTFVREAGGVRRTPDEDDAVMVLRFGARANLDLTAPLTCRARSGDDW